MLATETGKFETKTTYWKAVGGLTIVEGGLEDQAWCGKETGRTKSVEGRQAGVTLVRASSFLPPSTLTLMETQRPGRLWPRSGGGLAPQLS